MSSTRLPVYMHGTKICPAQLNNRSTAALLDNAERYFMKASANHDICAWMYAMQFTVVIL